MRMLQEKDEYTCTLRRRGANGSNMMNVEELLEERIIDKRYSLGNAVIVRTKPLLTAVVLTIHETPITSAGATCLATQMHASRSN